jgi:hypothetical protein
LSDGAPPTPTPGTGEHPKGDAVIIVEILIPLTSNERAAFDADHHLAFEAHLIAAFGGYSLLPGTVRSGWIDAGVVYTDETRVYAVAVSSLLADGHKVVAIAELAKVHYGQLAIFVRYLGLAEVL